MFWSQAYAQTAAAAQQPSLLDSLFPILAMFVVFYFFIILPQKKRRKQHDEFLGNLKRGDQVITNSGIFGKVEGITESFVTLEIADDVKVKILKSQIAGLPKEQTK